MDKKISIVIGTRPEIIKMTPVIRNFIKKKILFYLIHTGQHYSENMDAIFLKQLNLPQPDFYLGVGSGSHGAQTASILEKVEKIFLENKISMVLVQGDTNSVVAASLAASKTNVKIGHVEAGLRSFDRSMPEEINRIVSDHLSHFLFAPTKTAKKNLIAEGIRENVFITGNTIVDALKENIKKAEKLIDKKVLFEKIGIEREKYILLTLHRQENVDNKERFKEILEGINDVKRKTHLNIVFPIHPRTEKQVKFFNLEKYLKNLTVIEPLGYFEFLLLEKDAKIILTDSGGIQEESCVLKIPCVSLRENTERPETLQAGSNILAGWRKENIVSAVEKMFDIKTDWKNPFGNGRSGQKIVEIIEKYFIKERDR